MRGLLIKAGIDQTFGGWNCPLDPLSLDFVYIPIPEQRPFHNGCSRQFAEYIPSLKSFCERAMISYGTDLQVPQELLGAGLHLDPDFQYLTYGDSGIRAALLQRLSEGDVIGFYAGLKSYDHLDKGLIYALIGLFIVQEVVEARAVPPSQWNENAHIRRIHSVDCDDVVVRARPALSGRLTKCIPIGEWRNRAYRVRHELLTDWGGVSANDGFIQRCVWPPSLLNPSKFYDWFCRQQSEIVQSNY